MTKLVRLLSLLIVSIFALSSGCSDEDSVYKACSYNKPIEEIPWLVSLIVTEEKNEESAQYTYFTKARYEDKTVYTYGNCCPNCNYVRTVWNCDGEEIGVIGTQDSDIKIEDLVDEEVVWSGENTVCNL